MSVDSVSTAGLDPRFLEAYSYTPSFKGTTDVTQTVESPTVQEQQVITQAPAIQAEPEKGKGGAIATGVILTGVATLIGIAAHKGNGKGFAKVGDGLKQIFNGVKGKLGIGKKAASSKAPKEFTITTINDKTVCRMPNRINRIGVVEENGKLRQLTENEIKATLNELGFTDSKVQLRTAIKDASGNVTGYKLADGVKLYDYEFVHDGVTYTVKSGKVVKISGTNALTLEKFNNPMSENKDLVEAVKKKITGFEKGENIEELSNIKFTHTQDGLTRIFTKANNDATEKLTGAITDRHAAESTRVKAFLDKNPNADKVYKAFKENKFDDLGIASAEMTTKLNGKDCTFFIENGEITAVKYENKVHKKGTDEFHALHHEFTSDFDNALKNKSSFKNVVYK